jgi:hypothetical protein
MVDAGSFVKARSKHPIPAAGIGNKSLQRKGQERIALGNPTLAQDSPSATAAIFIFHYEDTFSQR